MRRKKYNMMVYIKDETSGMTIVSLVITIILLLILAGIGLNYGTNSVKTAEESAAVAELNMVQHAILERYTKYKVTNNEDILVGTPIGIDKVKQITDPLGITLKDTGNYFELNQEQLEDLGITDVKNIYVVNYITGEALNETKTKTEAGKVLYIYARETITNE